MMNPALGSVGRAVGVERLAAAGELANGQFPRQREAMRRLAALLLAFAASCGHDRAALIAAHVATGQGDAQEDLEGASGTLDCPGELFPQDLGNSDEDGDLRAQHMGSVPLACSINISMAGYQPYKAALQDVCASPAGGGCQTVDVRIVLAPEPGKSSGGSK
jgi:hypothetical protein